MNFILIIMLAIWVAYTAFAGNAQYIKFKAETSSARRLRYYRRWLLESWLMGLFAVVSMLVLGQPDKLIKPLINPGFSGLIPQFVKADPGAMQGFLSGLAVGVTMLIVITILRIRKNAKNKLMTIGDFEALMPRNSRERKYAAAMAISAGINEELLFRAAVPVILFGLIHNAQIAIGLSIIIFALGHVYQGWKGLIATGLMGWFLMKVFLLTGSILAPMALHAFVDMMSLVILPWIASRAAKQS